MTIARLAPAPLRPMHQPAPLAANDPTPPPDEGDDDGEALKRAFLWSAWGAGLGLASSLATAAGYAFGGPSVGMGVRVALGLAGGIGGAWFVGDRMSSKPPLNRVLGFVAGAGAAALTGALGAEAALPGLPIMLRVAVHQTAAAGVAMYAGYGALILGEKEP